MNLFARIGGDFPTKIRMDVSVNFRDEAVAAAGQGFDVAGSGGGVSEGLADFVDGGVEAVVEVDEGVGGPELLLQLFAGDDFSGALEQQGEDLERLALQAELDSALAQFACAEVEFEDSEAGYPAAILRHDAVV